MKIRRTTSKGLNLDIWCQDHDPEQRLKGFNHQSDTLDNAGGTVTFKPYN